MSIVEWAFLYNLGLGAPWTLLSDIVKDFAGRRFLWVYRGRSLRKTKLRAAITRRLMWWGTESKYDLDTNFSKDDTSVNNNKAHQAIKLCRVSFNKLSKLFSVLQLVKFILYFIFLSFTWTKWHHLCHLSCLTDNQHNEAFSNVSSENAE